MLTNVSTVRQIQLEVDAGEVHCDVFQIYCLVFSISALGSAKIRPLCGGSRSSKVSELSEPLEPLAPFVRVSIFFFAIVSRSSNI